MTGVTADTGVFDEIISTDTSFAEDIEDNDNEVDKKDHEFTAKRLLNVSFALKDDDGSGNRGTIYKKKRGIATDAVEKKFQLEHRQKISFAENIENNDNERSKNGRRYTAERLANFSFALRDDNGSGNRVTIQKKKRGIAIDTVEKTFQLEHRQRIYYGSWWLVVTAWNVPLHYLLWSTDRDRTIVLSLNFLVTILLRNEHVVWLLYLTGAGIATRLPARGRCHVVKSWTNKMTVNIGGMHTCSSFFLGLDLCWVVIAEGIGEDGIGSAAATPRRMIHFVVLAAILVVLVVIIVLALPLWRHRHHNIFEFSHRFGGWTVSGLILIDVFVSLCRGGDEVFGLNAMSTWLIVATVFITIWPWVTLKACVTATVFAPSDMMCILTWNGKPWYFSPGTAGKVATHPLGQYHSFALLPHIGGGKNKCVMAIANAGDWTSALIKKARDDDHMKQIDVDCALPETSETNATIKIALQRFAHPGFMFLVRTYKRVVCIGTGAGIAPISAYLPEPSNEMLILWFGRNFEDTYGPLYHFVAGYRNSILIDTRESPSERNPYSPSYELDWTMSSMRRIVTRRTSSVRFGEERPDIPRLAKAAVEMFNADAVFIVSRPELSYDLCYEMWKVGIHAYSATWDS